MKTYKELTKKETEVMSAALKACADFKAETISEKQFLQRVKSYNFAAGKKQAGNAKEAIISHFDAIELERASVVVMPTKKGEKLISLAVDAQYKGLNGCIKKYAQTLKGVNGEAVKDELIKMINESGLSADNAKKKIDFLSDTKDSFINLKSFWFAYPMFTLTPSDKVESDTLRPYHYTCTGFDYNHTNDSRYFLEVVNAFLFSNLDTYQNECMDKVDNALTRVRKEYKVLCAMASPKMMQDYKEEESAGKPNKDVIIEEIDMFVGKMKDKDRLEELKRRKMKVAKLTAELLMF